MYQMTSEKRKQSYGRAAGKLIVRTFVPKPLSALDMIKKDKLMVSWSEIPLSVEAQAQLQKSEKIFDLCFKRITWNTVGNAIEKGRRVAKPIAAHIVGVNIFNSLSADQQELLIEKVQSIIVENKMGLCVL
jgi:hypothetical protein